MRQAYAGQHGITMHWPTRIAKAFNRWVDRFVQKRIPKEVKECRVKREKMHQELLESRWEIDRQLDQLRDELNARH